MPQAPQGAFRSASGEIITTTEDGRILLRPPPKRPQLRPLASLPGHRAFGRQRAMRELHELVVSAYDQQLRRILEAIEQYMRSDVLHQKGAQLFRPQDVERIRKIVRDYHLAFVIGAVHPEAAGPRTVQRLMDEGVLPQDLAYMYRPPTPRSLPPARMSFIDTSFDYGRLGIPLAGPRAPKDDPGEVTLASVLTRPPPPLTIEERAARDWARHSAAMHITGLGDRFGHDLATRSIEADREQRRKYEKLIREKLGEAIEKRRTWRQLRSEIGQATGDWSRNLGRIAATESHGAMQQGIAAGLKKREKKEPEEILVAKQPAPDACRDCVRLHLAGGAGSPPKVFKLSELEENGSNVGKKRASWKAVVGATHPWCGCELIHVPDGWGFDADGNLVPEFMTRSEWLDYDLRKAMDMTYGDAVPEQGVAIRVSDPRVREECEKIVARTPPEVFDKKVGVTLITTDIPRAQNPLEEHDFAYWTANEIRLMNTLPPEKIERVLPHEIGHSLNVHLMNKFGGVRPVRDWHDKLWKISRAEGFVSDYAKKLPIENAAEVSMLYLYNRKRLMLVFPRQFAFVHRDYRDVFRRKRAA